MRNCTVHYYTKISWGTKICFKRLFWWYDNIAKFGNHCLPGISSSPHGALLFWRVWMYRKVPYRDYKDTKDLWFSSTGAFIHGKSRVIGVSLTCIWILGLPAPSYNDTDYRCTENAGIRDSSALFLAQGRHAANGCQLFPRVLSPGVMRWLGTSSSESCRGSGLGSC